MIKVNYNFTKKTEDYSCNSCGANCQLYWSFRNGDDIYDMRVVLCNECVEHLVRVYNLFIGQQLTPNVDLKPPTFYNLSEGVDPKKFSDEAIKSDLYKSGIKGLTKEQKIEFDKMYPTTLAGRGLQLAITIKIAWETFKKSYRQIWRNKYEQG